MINGKKLARYSAGDKLPSYSILLSNNSKPLFYKRKMTLGLQKINFFGQEYFISHIKQSTLLYIVHKFDSVINFLVSIYNNIKLSTQYNKMAFSFYSLQLSFCCQNI